MLINTPMNMNMTISFRRIINVNANIYIRSSTSIRIIVKID